MSKPFIYTFGDFHLNQANAQLLKQGHAVAISPKAFALLVYLLENRGKLVTKPELLDAIWGHRFITEGVLKSTVQLVRRALEDDAKIPLYLETVQRRGYRFIAEVTVLGQTIPLTSETTSRLSAHFVGREKELAQMHQHLTLALNGKPQLVFISGQAGIGKSSLIKHFVENITQQVVIGYGQCVEHYSQSEAYFPIFEALNQICLQQGNTALTLLEKIAPDWLVEMPWFANKNPTYPTHQPANSQTRMLRELGELLAQWSHSFPLLLVLEDIHCCDHATLDALAYLARYTRPAHWLVIASYRREQANIHSALTSMLTELHLRGWLHEIHLPLLSEQAVTEYLQHHSQGCCNNPTLITAIYQRCEGLPLFMAWLAEHFHIEVNQQALDSLPSDLEQSLERQFARLTPNQQQLLQVAAVTGRVFCVQLLAELLGITLEEGEQQCETLVRNKQFIGKVNVIWNLSQLEGYSFLHAYYLEFVYNRLASFTKSALHRQIAYWLEANSEHGDDTFSALALHFEHGGEFAKAIDYLQKSANMAKKRQAHHEVIALTRRALSLLPQAIPESYARNQREVALLTLLGMSMRTVQGYGTDEQAQVYQRALLLAKQLTDNVYLLPLLKAYAYFHLVRLELVQAAELAQQLLQLAEQLELPAFQVSANVILAGVNFAHGNQDFLYYANRAQHLYHAELDASILSYSSQHPLATLGYLRAWHAWLSGHTEQAIAIQQQTLAVIENLDHPVTEAFACLCSAVIWQLCGDWSSLQAMCKRAEVLAEQYDLASVARWSGFFQAELRIKQGHIDEGFAAMTSAFDNYWLSGSRGVFTFQMFAWYTEACLHHQQFERAETILRQAQQLLSKQPCFLDAEFQRLNGELALAKYPTQPKDAETWFVSALATAHRQGAAALALRAAISLTRLRVSLGQFDETDGCLRNAIADCDNIETHDIRTAKALLISLS